MQYHVPVAYPPLPAAPTAGSSVSGYAGSGGNVTAHDAAAGVPPSVSASSPGGGGVAVGLGLLGGRRLAVRVAPPPPARTSSSHTHETSSLSSDYARHHPADAAVGAAASGCAYTDNVAGPSTAAAGYGGGLVRISELRRQGVSAVESGLRLAAGGVRTTDRITVTHVGTGANADVFAPTFTPARRGRGTSGGRGGRRGAAGGRSRRGGSRSRDGSGSRASVSVALGADGQLCDYRWYTARGRRCFVYDGRTYKGSSAHRMWEAVKAVAQQRGLAQPTASPSSSSSSATTRAARSTRRAPTTGRAAPARTRSTMAAPAPAPTPVMAPPPHRASARARSAAERVLHAQHTARRAAPAVQNAVASARAEARLNAARLPAEWRELAENLGLLDEGDVGGVDELAEAERRALRGMAEAPMRTVAPAQPYTGSRGGPALTAYRGPSAEDVIEVSDSSSGSAAGTDTEDDESDRSGSNSRTSSGADRCESTRDATGPPARPGDVQWPPTSYFSEDESSGWSSSSSLPDDTARAPKRARVETQHIDVEGAATGSPRVRDYHGVQVVEEDGWVYPVEVYASQKQQQQQEQPLHSPSNTTTTTTATSSAQTRQPTSASRRVPAPAFLLYSRGAERTTAASISGAGGAAAESAAHALDHVPLADLYSQGGVNGVAGAAARPTAPASSFSLPTRDLVGGGMAVVRPSGTAIAVRPVASRRVAAPAPLASATVFPSADDSLDDFSAADLAGMFVTGEEIGGLRFDG